MPRSHNRTSLLGDHKIWPVIVTSSHVEQKAEFPERIAKCSVDLSAHARRVRSWSCATRQRARPSCAGAMTVNLKNKSAVWSRVASSAAVPNIDQTKEGPERLTVSHTPLYPTPINSIYPGYFPFATDQYIWSSKESLLLSQSPQNHEMSASEFIKWRLALSGKNQPIKRIFFDFRGNKRPSHKWSTDQFWKILLN